jgi:drug/metabolite transporter (DMT)-like permease
MDEASPAKVVFALLVMVAFFGGSLPAYKIASGSFGPATINLGRFALAVVVISAASARRPRNAVPVKALLVVGLFGLGLMTLFMSVGVDRGSAVIGSIVVGLEPIGVALAGVVLMGDRPSSTAKLALLVGFSGALVASGVFTQKTGPSPIFPMVLLLGTVITFSVYTANVRRIGKGVDPLLVTQITQIGALCFIVPACLLDVFNGGMIRHGSVSAKAAVAVVFLGCGSAVAYVLLCSVLASVPSHRVAVSMFLTPLFGVFFSWLLAGEDLHARDAVGGLLVLLALWISERGAQAAHRTAATVTTVDGSRDHGRAASERGG